MTKAQQVSQEESDRLCPQHNAPQPPHMALAQVVCALSLSLPAGPVGSLGGYDNPQRSTGLREGTGHLLIHSRDEWISGEPSQLPQALSARSPDRWEPIGETSCYSPRGPRASLLLTPHSPTRKRIQNTQDKHAFKNTHAWFGTLLRLSNIKRATLEERAGLLQ